MDQGGKIRVGIVFGGQSAEHEISMRQPGPTTECDTLPPDEAMRIETRP
jgi:D-alanine-D-alanine ligase-like ATP-grasp enzyme